MTTPIIYGLLTRSIIKSNNNGLFHKLTRFLQTPAHVNTTVQSEKQQKPTETVRLSGPYAMFGPGRIVQSVANTTSFNQRTTEYKITYPNTFQ